MNLLALFKTPDVALLKVLDVVIPEVNEFNIGFEVTKYWGLGIPKPSNIGKLIFPLIIKNSIENEGF